MVHKTPFANPFETPTNAFANANGGGLGGNPFNFGGGFNPVPLGGEFNPLPFAFELHENGYRSPQYEFIIKQIISLIRDSLEIMEMVLNKSHLILSQVTIYNLLNQHN
ncbi:hypothetical protein TNIN_375821 [Trichonephila inaurata madagascariensis]|uniref:Uncharacterized protein n=1 Tax=Trichonephila inaurata madagascariensis TaxID=2747483 RepID=A0A8X6WZ08_9ARAC|nr:hypothetical protein TNIN_375821 [Trichonephila inaurata madagascariensis]